MKRFERDLEKSLMNQARSSIMQGTHEVNCTWADRHEISNFHIHAGRNIITANQYYRFAGM